MYVEECICVDKDAPPLKIDMETKHEGLEDDFPIQTDDFQVPTSFSGVCQSRSILEKHLVQLKWCPDESWQEV